jgi:hypothetical protein
MAAIAAHLCRLYLTGTSTHWTTTTSLNEISGGADTSFQFPIGTVSAERAQVLDPTTAQDFDDDLGTTVAPDTLDHLFGIANFNSAVTNSPIKVGGSTGVHYLPLYEVGTVKDFSISVSADVLDKSTMDGGTFRDKLAGLVDLSGSLTLLETPNQDYDPSGDDIKLFDLLSDGTPKVLEIKFDPDSTEVFRAFIIIESYENTGAVDGLVETSISFQGALQSTTETGTTTGSAYSFGDIGS